MRYVLITNPEKIVTSDIPFGKTEPRVVESKGRDIIDYPIEEAKLDNEGNIIESVKPPMYDTTGRSLIWTIKAGETVEIPEYVANVLVKRYEFLTISEIPQGKKEEDIPKAKPSDGSIRCKHCGQIFSSTKGVALHIAHKHTETII